MDSFIKYMKLDEGWNYRWRSLDASSIEDGNPTFDPAKQLVRIENLSDIQKIKDKTRGFLKVALKSLWKIIEDNCGKGKFIITIGELEVKRYVSYRVTIVVEDLPSKKQRGEAIEDFLDKWVNNVSVNYDGNELEDDRTLFQNKQCIVLHPLSKGYDRTISPPINRSKIRMYDDEDIDNPIERSSYQTNYPIAVCKNEFGDNDMGPDAKLPVKLLMNITIGSNNANIMCETFKTRDVILMAGLLSNEKDDESGEYVITRDDLDFSKISAGITKMQKNDKHFYGTLFENIASQNSEGKIANANFSTKLFLSDSAVTNMLMAHKNPCRVILSEILVPLLLLAGYKKIDNKPIMVFGSENDDKIIVKSIKFPSDDSFLKDFNVTIVEGELPDGQTREFAISSKFGLYGHTPSLLALLEKKPFGWEENRRTEKLSREYFDSKYFQRLKDDDDRVCKFLTDLANSKMSRSAQVDFLCNQAFAKKNNTDEYTLRYFANLLNDNEHFLSTIYNHLFGFFDNMEFRQVEMDVGNTSTGAYIALSWINKRSGDIAESYKDFISIKAGTPSVPLGIKLKRLK